MQKFIAKVTFHSNSRPGKSFEVFAENADLATEKASAAVKAKYQDRGVGAAFTLHPATLLAKPPFQL